MSYHGCPIEPADWSDGDEPSEPKDCRYCRGTGYEDEDCTEICTCCDGTGVSSTDSWDDYDYDPTDYV